MAHSDAIALVPAFNESTVVAEVVAELRSLFDHVVVVDDGSRDTTAYAAKGAGAVVLRHRVNLGQGAALQTGFDHALSRPGIRYVVTVDADGQHRAEDAVALLELARAADLQVVLGTRYTADLRPQDMPWSRRLLLRAALRFSRATTGLALTDTHNGLRVLRRDALTRLRLVHNGMAHASELEHHVARLGLTWAEAPVTVRYTAYSRAKGQSGLNAVNIIFDLATARLRASS